MVKPHVFAGNPLDRGERERRDEEWISKQATNPDAKFLVISGPRVLISTAPDPGLAWAGAGELESTVTELGPVFLGMQNGASYFAVDISGQDGVGERLLSPGGRVFEDGRAAAELFGGPDAGIMAQGMAQINWHKRHGFCSVCGQKTEVQRGGQKRVCPACNAQHFPRVDPVTITVVADGDRCLLGQSRGRQLGINRYSALAGFVDQGESIEEAVAREVMEEAGIKVKNVRYHSSQPWPFPSSLMIGCQAEAATTDIHMDAEEMADVQWFDRKEVLMALEARSEKLTVPGPIAIAHHLITAWATQQVA